MREKERKKKDRDQCCYAAMLPHTTVISFQSLGCVCRRELSRSFRLREMVSQSMYVGRSVAHALAGWLAGWLVCESRKKTRQVAEFELQSVTSDGRLWYLSDGGAPKGAK